MESYTGPYQPSSVHSISGTVPGLLDPTQPGRLHRVQGSTLSFAFFNPLAASSSHRNLENLSLNEQLSRPKRVVIETIPGSEGASFWRFVPRARHEYGVDSEGTWPRLVQICGEIIHCSQDQWDIYKLDPEYDCFAPAPPNIPVISKRKGKERAVSGDPPHPTAQGTYPFQKTKRRLSTPSDEESPTDSRKRFRSAAPGSDNQSELGDDASHPIPIMSDEEDEVEDLLGGSSRDSSARPSSHKSSGKTSYRRRRREGMGANREWRGEKVASRTQTAAGFYDDVREIDMVDLTTDNTSREHSASVPPVSAAKRKISPETQPYRPDDPSGQYPNQPDGQTRKRLRTVSPGFVKRQYESLRSERERRRKETFKARFDSKRAHWHERFFHDLMGDIPEVPGGGEQAHACHPTPHPDQGGQAQGNGAVDVEALRQAAIEESRRKLAELEKDKPLWEEAARKRMEAERAEEERKQAQREAQRRAAEAEERRRRREAEQAEAERRAQAARENAERQQHQRRRYQEQQRWSYGPWTTQRALERYKALSEAFDNAKFAESNPVTLDSVPWPVLQSPTLLTIEDIDWNAVEAFFKSVRTHMRPQDYKTFVEKSHRRFHPDRWRARGILRSVADEETRGCLEVAANTVAQALTPLWREVVKGG